MNLYKCVITGKSYDPMKCSRRLLIESNNEINNWLLAYNTAPDSATEQGIVNVIRKVFELPDYDNTLHKGFTDEQAMAALANFTEFLAKKL